MDETKRAYIELHIAVILFGFTAILGKWITLAAIAIVWWRVLFTWISYLFLIDFKKLFRDTTKKQIGIFLAIGIIVGLHWITFYGAIKMSNASIGVICLATTSFFTALLEPLILKRPFYWYELALGILILPGMYFIVQGVELSYRWGILVGLISALFASLFSIFNKKYIKKASPVAISGIEMFGVWAFISIIGPFVWFLAPNMSWTPSWTDVGLLVVLALLCTTLAYVLALRSLQHITAFASNLVVNLEPVYGILLAIVLLSEHQDLDLSFYVGVIIICAAIFSYPFIRNRFSKPELAS
jgi:drug/metabolite transporter (DMT)-like permease